MAIVRRGESSIGSPARRPVSTLGSRGPDESRARFPLPCPCPWQVTDARACRCHPQLHIRYERARVNTESCSFCILGIDPRGVRAQSASTSCATPTLAPRTHGASHFPRSPTLAPDPEWRNGIRSRLKIGRPQGHEGSTPSSGTNQVSAPRSGRRSRPLACQGGHGPAGTPTFLPSVHLVHLWQHRRLYRAGFEREPGLRTAVRLPQPVRFTRNPSQRCTCWTQGRIPGSELLAARVSFNPALDTSSGVTIEVPIVESLDVQTAM